MCTIIVRHKIDDWCTTLVASNRDEFYDRPATAPRVLSTSPLVVGGRDETKGGTWFGVTDRGLYVGLTNQARFGLPDDSLRSRGELVLEALRTGSHTRVRDYLGTIDPCLYNEFNIIFGDGESLEAAYGRQSNGRVELEPLGAGVHVLCNDRLGSDQFPKAQAARARVASIDPQPWKSLKAQLADVLSDGSLPDAADVPAIPENTIFDQELARRLQAICVATPIYGTVSSTIAAVEPGCVLEYHHRRVPPTDAAFDEYTHLLRS